jgi:hypothetical protein
LVIVDVSEVDSRVIKDGIIFVGASKSTLALQRFKKLQEFGCENYFNAIWCEKRNGIARILWIIRLFFLSVIYRNRTWVCHGSYWPELVVLIIFGVKYSLIVQGSELYLDGPLRRKLHCWILNNSLSVGCRTIEQKKLVSGLAASASPFVLRMDDYAPPVGTDGSQRSYTISVRASAPLYRQEFALTIAKKVNDICENELKTLYICYNGPDQDPENDLSDEKIHGPIDQLSLAKLLSDAQFVVSVPRTDGLSNVVIEALIQGALIICSEATLKDEFEEYRERFIVVPEEILDVPEALTKFFDGELKKHDLSRVSRQDLLSIHQKFSFDPSSLRTLIGWST